jgi:hypothetical protein
VKGVDYYLNEQGLFVFTKEYHLDRGYCCGNGCVNCPYDYAEVPEPKKQKLLAKRNIHGKENNQD